MRIRIMNLGDIMTINIMQGIEKLATIIAAKKTDASYDEIKKTVAGVMAVQNDKAITEFKMGKIKEDEFNLRMISAIKEATQTEITTEEFDTAWSAIYPPFSQIKPLLEEAIAFNKTAGKTIFISFTNPKDMRYLSQQLQEYGKIDYNSNKVDEYPDPILFAIGGIDLYVTYAPFSKSKAELIAWVINVLTITPPSTSTLAKSISTVFNSKPVQAETLPDIKYVRCVNNIKDPILAKFKEDYEKTTQEVEQKASSLSVDTIIWKKYDGQTLTDALVHPQPVSRMIPISML